MLSNTMLKDDGIRILLSDLGLWKPSVL